MSKGDIAKQISELRERAWSVWTDAHKLVREYDKDDRIFLSHPVKSPTIEVIDSLAEIGNHLGGLTPVAPDNGGEENVAVLDDGSK